MTTDEPTEGATPHPDATKTLGDMDPDMFRHYGYQVVDRIAEYLARPDRHDVLPSIRPGDVAKQIAEGPPDRPESMDAILADYDRVILPGTTHWNHPGFRLLRHHGLGPGHPGRDAGRGAERERHAVAIGARPDGAGRRGAGLAAPAPGPARQLRRDHHGHGVVQHAVRPGRSP